MNKKKIFSLILALCMAFITILPINAFAIEENTENKLEATLIEENDQNYDDAIRVLGLTEEEAAECKLYSIQGVSIPNNTTYWFDWFSFSDYNNGSYWTNNGTQLKWGYEWHGTYTNEYDLRLGVYLYKYPSNSGDIVDQMWAQNGESRNSSWLSVTRGLDYQFKYYCNYLTQSGTGYATVHMYVATKG